MLLEILTGHVQLKLMSKSENMHRVNECLMPKLTMVTHLLTCRTIWIRQIIYLGTVMLPILHHIQHNDLQQVISMRVVFWLIDWLLLFHFSFSTSIICDCNIYETCSCETEQVGVTCFSKWNQHWRLFLSNTIILSGYSYLEAVELPFNN